MRSALRKGRAAKALLGAALAAAGCGQAPELARPSVIRGHTEVVLEADGTLTPLFFEPRPRVGLCLDVEPAADTSGWRAVLTLDGRRLGGLEPAADRVPRTVCFDAVVGDEAPAAAAGPAGPGAPMAGRSTAQRLCGELLDEFDGRRYRLPCHRVRLTAETAERDRLRAGLGAVMEDAGRRPVGELEVRLESLAAEAEAADLPLLAARLRLAVVYFLSNGGETERADERLAALPAWLGRVEAGRLAAEAAVQRANSHLLAGRRRAAWRALDEAEELYLELADPQRFNVTMMRAGLLTDAEATQEAVERLRESLAACDPAICHPVFLDHAERQLARLVITDPYASEEDLAAAEAILDRARTATEDSPMDEANRLIAGAYARLVRGGDPAPSLAAARELLERTPGGGEQREALVGWAEWVAGMAALEHGDAERALEICRRLTATDNALFAETLAAYGWSCAGRAHRQRGELAAADLAYGKALALHEHTAASQGLFVAAGLGPQTADAAHAARVAVELGEAAHAWDLLADLDRRSAHEDARRRCREQAPQGAIRARWEELDGERERLLRELAELELPTSAAHQSEADAVRRSLQQRLQALWWEWPGCAATPAADPAAGPGNVRFRAFGLEDEVILLERTGGEVAVARRTPLARSEVMRLATEIRQAFDDGKLDDAAWRELLRPLAEALLPAPSDELGPVASFALHGPLQAVPLAALPLSGPAGPEDRWLADRTVVAIVPAGARAAPRDDVVAQPPLFVVDPEGDLLGGSRLLATYRELFPAARVLHAGAATRAAVQAALEGTEWLHVDAHGVYEPLFPELSSLRLHDGALRLVELAELPAPRRFANLSGCATGSWRFTADSGRFGLGGLVARLGVPWVIASRAGLPDEVAGDYNAAFYRAVADGRSVPEAHRRALRDVQRHGAVRWARLVLLTAPPSPQEAFQAGAVPEEGSFRRLPKRWSPTGEG